ncbi:MAG: type I-C CRISPR-associated protein Cas8c/Csd1 [Methanocorpusculum sp.]|nr:type I-C CRISPR-associated protein Cas8c/Csd1 [Methanocorpusculum sp.]
MSWIEKLCETYDNCAGNVLHAESVNDLLPIGHTTNYAQIEITINEKGDFLSARTLEKNEELTIIPCTEDSANRTSGLEPHPLFDKLQYIAGDYAAHVSGKTSGYDLYIDRLEKWVNSPCSNEIIKAIYLYLKKGTVISDLIGKKVLYEAADGSILEKWTEDTEKPLIFQKTSAPSDSFVRFRVEIPGETEARAWLNEKVRQDFISYYLSSFEENELCYVSGKSVPPSRKTSAKIRSPADKAKLISSNDTSGFTFRGRAETANQAATVSYEASQKSMNALKWLIHKQGYSNAEQTIVAWGTKNENLPSISTEYENLFGDLPETEQIADTREEYAKRLNKAISGYSANLSDSSNVVVMGMDSPSFQGRLSITYYRELAGTEFLRRIKRWHQTASWYPLTRTKYVDGEKPQKIQFFGAPSPSDIVTAAHGRNADDKLKKAVIERLLPCIIDGKTIPRDIVTTLADKASRPFAMERWEWDKTVGIACAVIRKYYNDRVNKRNELENYTEVWNVELNTQETDRNYLFGRLLAYARRIEEYANYINKTEPRQTNAERFMLQFKKHPAKTWGELYQKLLPYLSRFRSKSPESLGNRYEAEMNEVAAKLNEIENGFTNESLTPVYLLGYQSQMNRFNKEIQELRAKRNEAENGD